MTRGKYLLASEIVNKLVQAEPDNEAARTWGHREQIGYRKNPGLRNSFLTAAYELRSGFRKVKPQTQAARRDPTMSTDLFLNFLGIRMGSRKAEGMRFTINLITPNNGEKFLVELEKRALTNIKGFLADKPIDPDHQPLGSGADHDGCENSRCADRRTGQQR